MTKDERWTYMIQHLRQQGRASVKSLSEKLGVSNETIRKDLEALEDQQLVKRYFGGAMPVEQPTKQPVELYDPSLASRMALFMDQKQAIAQLAASIIEPNDVVVLDASTTTMCMVPFIPRNQDVSVITNSYSILNSLIGFDDVNVFLTGGYLRRSSTSLLGQAAVHALDGYNANTVFMSGRAVSIGRGLMDPRDDEVEIKRKFLSISNKAYLLADSSKFTLVSSITTCPIDRFAAIISDDLLDPRIAEQIREMGIELILAHIERI